MTRLALFTTALLAAGAAHAATFSTTGEYDVNPRASVAYQSGDLTMTVTGMSGALGADTPDHPNGKVSLFRNGLGVKNGVEKDLVGTDWDSYELDNASRSDWMVFTFNKRVTLNTISFTTSAGDDGVKLFSGDGAGGFTGLGAYTLKYGTLGRYTLPIPGGFVGRQFAIAANQAGNLAGVTDLRVSGVSADATPAAPVPLPAPAFLTLGALAALGLVGRRRGQ